MKRFVTIYVKGTSGRPGEGRAWQPWALTTSVFVAVKFIYRLMYNQITMHHSLSDNLDTNQGRGPRYSRWRGQGG